MRSATKRRASGKLPKKVAKKRADAKSLSRPEKREVARMIRGAGETKMVVWYSGGSNPLGNGSRSGWAYEPQNNAIAVNTTDIKRLVPIVLAGTGDNQRIGEKITPQSLVVHGNIALNTTNVLTPISNQDLFAVIYVLQHVSLKTYQSLQSAATVPPTGGNDFNQLLKTGEGDTIGFSGFAYQASLPVADEYYKLCAKKVVPLRYAGAQVVPPGTPIPGGAGVVSVSNSHNFNARYTFNLTKHLPKTLKYPETNVTTGNLGDPTNSSLFLAVAYYRMDGLSPGAATFLQNQYVSIMKYKDI